MKTKLARGILLAVLPAVLQFCIAPIPKEKLLVKLTDEWGERIGEDSLFTFKVTDTTDVTLPPIVTQFYPVVGPAGRSAQLLDTVVVKAIITKRGNVKRVWIASSTNAYFNQAVLKSVLLRQYQPAMRHGIPFDTLITVAVPLKKGE